MSQRATASAGAVAESTAGGSGILRIGTTSYIDSFNPWNYIEGQGLNAMIMAYPLLVQVDYSSKEGYYIVGDWARSWKASTDGKTWTFKLRPNGKWSDGKPMTADDAAWTINTTVKYVDGATAVQGTSVNHVVRATAPNKTTLIVRYNAPVGNALWLIGALPIVPRHIWEPYEKKEKGGKALKTYRPEGKLPMVTGGAYTLKSYEKKGTTVFIVDPNFYGPKSNADAVALTFYTNSDAMIADLRRGNLDWIDQVPFNAVNAVKKSSGVKVNEWPGGEITNITWNSNPLKPKNRELLDPRVKKALSMCVNRNKMIQIVFSGYATKVESLVGHISPFENPNLGPTQYNCSAANKALDKLGYKRGSDGIRVAPATSGKNAQPAHAMSYEVIVPTSTRLQRHADVRDRQGGVGKARRDGEIQVRRRCDRELCPRDRCQVRRHEEHRLLEVRHRDVGLDRRPRAGLPAVRGDEGPVVLVERHGLGQPRLRQALPAAERDRESREAAGDHLQDAEDGLRRVRVHAAHEPRGAGCDVDEVDRLQESAERVLEDLLHEPQEGPLS